jgi:hypothetical protein
MKDYTVLHIDPEQLTIIVDHARNVNGTQDAISQVCLQRECQQSDLIDPFVFPGILLAEEVDAWLAPDANVHLAVGVES